jgi:hypothetical protein
VSARLFGEPVETQGWECCWTVQGVTPRQLEIMAAILEHVVIEKIFTYLRLQARAPPRAAARAQAHPGVTLQVARRVGAAGTPRRKAQPAGAVRAEVGDPRDRRS